MRYCPVLSEDPNGTVRELCVLYQSPKLDIEPRNLGSERQIVTKLALSVVRRSRLRSLIAVTMHGAIAVERGVNETSYRLVLLCHER
jgi:hypothetical protein